jgi:alpha-galactosidase
VSAGDIRHNLETLTGLCDRLPLEIVQIDDGFESLPGDWFNFAPSFPGGVAPLAAEIRTSGFTPGLWLAPFIVHPAARLAAEHPDWLLRGRGGRPVNAGFGWNRFTRALDLTHPEACEWAAGLVHTAVHEWGFTYLKLDFLYAAALPGRRFDPTLSRAQVLRHGLEALRKAAGRETFLMGCACPLGPAIGLFDAMRIGADTARRWHPSVNGIQAFIRSEPNLPAARNALHNALSRASLHRRWWVNDPDCLLARSQPIPGSRDRPRSSKAKIASYLTLAEVQSAATAIALTGGSLLLSDDLSALPPERLRLAGTLLPPIGHRPQVMDWFDASTPRRLPGPGRPGRPGAFWCSLTGRTPPGFSPCAWTSST